MRNTWLCQRIGFRRAGDHRKVAGQALHPAGRANTQAAREAPAEARREKRAWQCRERHYVRWPTVRDWRGAAPWARRDRAPAHHPARRVHGNRRRPRRKRAVQPMHAPPRWHWTQAPGSTTAEPARSARCPKQKIRGEALGSYCKHCEGVAKGVTMYFTPHCDRRARCTAAARALVERSCRLAGIASNRLSLDNPHSQFCAPPVDSDSIPP